MGAGLSTAWATTRPDDYEYAVDDVGKCDASATRVIEGDYAR